MNNWYDGKQQDGKKVVINLQVSWEVNDYKGGILMISISYNTNCNYYISYWKDTAFSILEININRYYVVINH